MNKRQSLKNNESGMVAIIVTMIILLILSLIITGFAQLARREEREALDRQLSNQAQYAAEAGINAYKKIIYDKTQNGTISTLGEKTGCQPDDPAFGATLGDNILSVKPDVKYTCVFLKYKQQELKYQNATPDHSTVAKIKYGCSGPCGTDNLTISWQNSANGQNYGSSAATLPFPDNVSWGVDKISILRIELSDVSNFNRDEVTKNTFTFYAYPKQGLGTTLVPFKAAGAGGANLSAQGKVWDASCDDTQTLICRVTITGIDSSHLHYLHVTPINNPTQLDICPALNSGDCNTSETLNESQWSIDVTGKAQDELKRIQVRLDPEFTSGGDGDKPEFSFNTSNSLCKLLEAWPGGVIDGCPNPFVPSGGSSGLANFDKGCGAATCPSGGGGFSYTSATDERRWHYDFVNRTSSPPLTNATCRWEFGDNSNIPDRTDNCQNGDFFTEVYPVKNQCITYNASLTVTFNNGSISTTEKSFSLPWNNSPQFNSPCSP